MYMFIVCEVNKGIAKTLAWCHSQSAVIVIPAFKNIEIEVLLSLFLIDHAYIKTIKTNTCRRKTRWLK